MTPLVLIKSQPDEDFQIIFVLNRKMYVAKEQGVWEILPSEIECHFGNRFIYAEVDESGYLCPWYIDISEEDLDSLMKAVESLEIEYKVGKFPDQEDTIHFFDMTDPRHLKAYSKCIKNID